MYKNREVKELQISKFWIRAQPCGGLESAHGCFRNPQIPGAEVANIIIMVIQHSDAGCTATPLQNEQCIFQRQISTQSAVCSLVAFFRY